MCRIAEGTFTHDQSDRQLQISLPLLIEQQTERILSKLAFIDRYGG
jgi:hypothetical protein